MMLVPPTIEPLTLAEAKLRAGLDWLDGDVRDAQMTGFIQAARSRVEQDTGVALLTQTHVIEMPAGGCYAAMPWRPVQSVTFASVDPLTGVSTPWTSTPFVLPPSSIGPTLPRLFVATGVWPSNLWATVVVGFASIALLQASAPGLVFAVGLLAAHYATAGRDLVAVGHIVQETPYGYDDAIEPYRLVSLA